MGCVTLNLIQGHTWVSLEQEHDEMPNQVRHDVLNRLMNARYPELDSGSHKERR
tara:strand:+ start:8096 stop:8257 length:162 start_codon:yes stop_codon:yes gene_type:complete